MYRYSVQLGKTIQTKIVINLIASVFFILIAGFFALLFFFALNNFNINISGFSLVMALLFKLSLGIIPIILINKKHSKNTIVTFFETASPKNIMIIFTYSLFNGLSELLLFKSAIYLPASILFPIITGGTIIITLF